jgi:hippurate hydrolase
VPEERLAELEKAGELPSLHSPRYYPEIEPTLSTGVIALSSASLDLLKAKK